MMRGREKRKNIDFSVVKSGGMKTEIIECRLDFLCLYREIESLS